VHPEFSPCLLDQFILGLLAPNLPQAKTSPKSKTGHIAGSTGGTFPGPSGGSNDVFLRKYDPDGDVIWTWQFGSAAFDLPYGIFVNATGIYVTGYTLGTLPGQTNAGGADAFVRKYDPSGI